MEVVAQIAPFGDSPGLAAYLCLECGSVESTLIPAVMNGTRPMTESAPVVLPSKKNIGGKPWLKNFHPTKNF
jgi:hypothetical protein